MHTANGQQDDCLSENISDDDAWWVVGATSEAVAPLPLPSSLDIGFI